jgi:hypothetical protein
MWKTAHIPLLNSRASRCKADDTFSCRHYFESSSNVARQLRVSAMLRNLVIKHILAKIRMEGVQALVINAKQNVMELRTGGAINNLVAKRHLVGIIQPALQGNSPHEDLWPCGGGSGIMN